jgi:hypothetical protein
MLNKNYIKLCGFSCYEEMSAEAPECIANYYHSFEDNIDMRCIEKDKERTDSIVRFLNWLFPV